MLYFAYGSNLSSRRLRQRVPSATLIATGSLPLHRLKFHKIGRDGSGKCDAFYTGERKDILLGAVYKITPDEKQFLDMAEGLGKGYEIKTTSVIVNDGQHMEAFAYFATRIAEDIIPFHWYKEHVLAGAREHSFPASYLREIAAIKTVVDPDIERTEAELTIYHSD